MPLACPSGPTSLEWAELSSGVLDLGRSAVAYVTGDCYADDLKNERTRAHARTVFEMVRREVEAGRPAVVWGLGIPEFGVVRGVEGEEYLTLPYGPVPDRVRWDEIDAPGGPFWWPEADQALFDAIKENLRPDVPVIDMDLNVNDPQFARRCAETLLELMKQNN